MYALELAYLIEDNKNDISIQHILQIGDYGEPYIIKHWRQDWSYQNQDFFYMIPITYEIRKCRKTG